jgi:hypothetical protein
MAARKSPETLPLPDAAPAAVPEMMAPLVLTAPARPPIPDANGNGKLDGEDVRVQLDRESRDPNATLTEWNGHALFEAIGTRKFSAQMRELVEAKGTYTGNEIRVARDQVQAELRDTVSRFGAMLENNPLFRHALEQNMKSVAQQRGHTPEQTETLVHLQRVIVDFAETFPKTFPKGMALEPVDMLDLMNRFGGIAAPKKPQGISNR